MARYLIYPLLVFYNVPPKDSSRDLLKEVLAIIWIVTQPDPIRKRSQRELSEEKSSNGANHASSISYSKSLTEHSPRDQFEDVADQTLEIGRIGPLNKGVV